MAFTLPTGFKSGLEAAVCRFVVAYELELDAGTLRYSSQAFTWNSNPYTALAVSTSPIIDKWGSRVPEVRVRFSNVNNTLRSQLDPTDLLTGERMTVRLLLRDATDAFLAGSIILHPGTMEQPKFADENTIELVTVGLGAGILGDIPPRATSLWCNVHKFADAFDCNYVKSTDTASAVGSPGNTIEVDNAQPFQDELDRLPSGTDILITVGDDTGLHLTGADTVASPNTITVTEAPTWAISEAVSFDKCDRDYKACQARARTHEFQGFRGVDDLLALRFAFLRELYDEIKDLPFDMGGIFVPGGGGQFLPPGNRSERTTAPEAQPLSDFRRTVPIIYGRRLVSGLLIERSVAQWTGQGINTVVDFLALSEGEIDSVVNWYGDGVRQEEAEDHISGGNKVIGIYYRVGGIGLDDTETEAEYDADPVTRLRTQNRDFLSNVADPYSRTAYVTMIQQTDDETGIPNIGDISFDVKGIKIQKYTSGGAPDGAKAMSRNPLWQVVDLYTATTYGLGRLLTTADLDFSVIKTEADYCDVAVDGPVANVSGTTGDDQDYTVDSTEGFHRGMPVEYDDGVSPTSDEVVEVLSPTSIRLGTARPGAAAPDTITSKTPRFTSDAYLTRGRNAQAVVESLLNSCLGYRTYNESGKIQLRVERAVSAVTDAHYKDFSAAQGYAIKSFRWLDDEDLFGDPETNRVIAITTSPNNAPEEAHSTDFDHLETPRALKPLVLGLPHVDNRDVGQRNATIRRKKFRTLGRGAQIVVGPIGVQHQIGDRIQVTHTVPNWTSADKRIIRKEVGGLGNDNELLCKLTVVDYQDIYGDVTAQHPDTVISTAPTMTLTAEPLSAGRVKLSWTIKTGRGYSKIVLYKHSASMSSSPAIEHQIFVATRRKGGFPGHYIYHATDDEIGTTLYFQARLVGRNGESTLSNEVTAIPVPKDPTDDEDEQGLNMIAGSEMDNPGMWEFTEPGVTSYDPDTETQVGGSDGPYANPADAYDTDGDFAEADVTTATEFFHHEWGFSAGGSETGRLRIRHSAVKSASTKAERILAAKKSNQKIRWSSDGGLTYNQLGVSGTTPTDYSSEVFTATRTDIKIRARTKKVVGHVTGSVKGRVHNITWDVATGAAPWSIVANSVGALLSDSVTHAEISRAFPGMDGDPDFIVPNGQTLTCIIHCKAASPDAPLLMDLYQHDEDTYTNLLTVTAGEMEAGWNAFANLFTASAKLEGPFDIVIRTLSQGEITFDKPQVYWGDGIKSDSLSPEELRGHRINYEHGRRASFPRGPWTATNKKAAVT